MLWYHGSDRSDKDSNQLGESREWYVTAGIREDKNRYSERKDLLCDGDSSDEGNGSSQYWRCDDFERSWDRRRRGGDEKRREADIIMDNGWTSTGFYVLVWYTYRGEDTIRIIGGRKIR